MDAERNDVTKYSFVERSIVTSGVVFGQQFEYERQDFDERTGAEWRCFISGDMQVDDDSHEEDPLSAVEIVTCDKALSKHCRRVGCLFNYMV